MKEGVKEVLFSEEDISIRTKEVFNEEAFIEQFKKLYEWVFW